MRFNYYFIKRINIKPVKLLEDGFNRSAYWNEYQTKIGPRNSDNHNFTRFPLDFSTQGVKRWFVLAIHNDGDKNLKETVIKSIFFHG